ncbi:alpha/beta hydrolase [Kitasatospora sp. CM 4170]|uniref:Alpha/beta fold hydrolase n=1 Tax=Kitasatospora aburaviensis TaxID=67265 RepID=A0ABW1F6Q2_9ACTN|nr:alpha/beta hydrolase [Kitasatospora sp. CM 4170]WNM49783.1 alpha/beta hydrolase [Kitasatospora sp. CM 4170]
MNAISTPMHSLSLATEVSGSGPGIVLAHGASGDIPSNFGPLIPILGRDHTVVAPSYPADDTPLQLDRLADALVESAVGAGVETFTVVGYSLGTAVAVRATARHPERVRGLVLAAGFAKADNRLRLLTQLWQDALRHGDLDGFARLALTTGFGTDFVNALPPEALPALVSQVAAAVPAGTPTQARLIAEADTTGDLPSITVPTLVVNATADLLVSPANSRFLAESIRGSEYAELPVGHVLMAEQPEQWHDLVTGFLARHGL